MTRIALIILGLVVCALSFGRSYVAAETIRSDGEQVLFELIPVDPRELFLGDYMRLNYDLRSDRQRHEEEGALALPRASSGVAVIRVEDGVATIVRFDRTNELAENERLIRFVRTRNWRNNITIGGDRYYFQSGTGERYEDAAYGIFRVMPDGRALLSGLADEKKRPILIAGEALPDGE